MVKESMDLLELLRKRGLDSTPLAIQETWTFCVRHYGC